MAGDLGDERAVGGKREIADHRASNGSTHTATAFAASPRAIPVVKTINLSFMAFISS